MWSCARKQVNHCVHNSHTQAVEIVIIIEKTADYSGERACKVQDVNKNATSQAQDGHLYSCFFLCYINFTWYNVKLSPDSERTAWPLVLCYDLSSLPVARLPSNYIFISMRLCKSGEWALSKHPHHIFFQLLQRIHWQTMSSWHQVCQISVVLEGKSRTTYTYFIV